MKWTTLRHNGVAFPPAYEYRGLTVKIKNEYVKLNPDQEEMLTAWAKKKDTPYVLDPVFQKNFLRDLKEKFDARFADIALDDIDFRELNAIADREKTANLSDEEKKKRSVQRKQERDDLKAKFGVAVIDGRETEVGAYLVEPPGILMGRGNHPLRGRWKDRVRPEAVTLNLDEEAPVPEGNWCKIVHDHESMWLATWYDKLSDKRKYIWLADSSHLRQERDQEKYIKAAKLETNVQKVRAEIAKRMNYVNKNARAEIEKQQKELHHKRQTIESRLHEATAVGDSETITKLESDRDKIKSAEEKLAQKTERTHADEMKTRQLASVCYLIDRLAMRVGDEKDEDEADTVGATTLRVEHVRIDKEKNNIEFDFLGKDSVEWKKSLPLVDNELTLAHNLEDLMQDKTLGDQIFDKIDSTHVNRFLSSIVPGLTAKVFRTYHATHAVRSYLLREGELDKDAAPTYQKEYVAKLANLEAAIVCNHKRTPPKNWQENLAKREVEVQRLRTAKPDVSKLQSQIPAREKALEKLLNSKPDAEKLQAQVVARQAALEKLRATQLTLPKLDEQIAQRQAAYDKLLQEQKHVEAATEELVKKKQAALVELETKKGPTEKKALAQHAKRIRASHKALAEAKKSSDAKVKKMKARVTQARKALETATKTKRERTRTITKGIAKAEQALKRAQHDLVSGDKLYQERLAKGQEALEAARRAPEVAQKNYEERVERAALQLELAKQTRDYNLGTSLKNYIDPSVYKTWGDHVGYDWKRLYTKALQRKFAWVEHVRTKWKHEPKEG
ncbi:MAG: hypothetical protein HZB51_27435 [Chloroflexi bacterium]|nr:hypothetical protein [Chloroflexota bacterium]